MTIVMYAACSRFYYACLGMPCPQVYADHIFQGHKQVLQQGHNQVPAQVPNQTLIDKYENKRIDKYKIRYVQRRTSESFYCSGAAPTPPPLCCTPAPTGTQPPHCRNAPCRCTQPQPRLHTTSTGVQSSLHIIRLDNTTY